MSSRVSRLGRGWSVGVVATAVAAASHALAGGGTPSPLALAAGVVFGGLLGTFALSARPSLVRLAVAVVGTQLAFHVVFSVLGTATGSVAAGSGATTADAMAGHAHAAAMAVPGSASHAHADTPQMWFAHTVAGLLTLALLRGAERAAWRVLVELARLVADPFRTRPVARTESQPPRAPLSPVAPVRLRGRLLVSAASRRGPPLAVAF